MHNILPVVQAFELYSMYVIQYKTCPNLQEMNMNYPVSFVKHSLLDIFFVVGCGALLHDGVLPGAGPQRIGGPD